MTDLWLDDIDRIRRLSSSEMADVERDLGNSVQIIRSLRVRSKIFGDLGNTRSLAEGYESLRSFLEANATAAIDRVGGARAALRGIAELYEELERKNDPIR